MEEHVHKCTYMSTVWALNHPGFLSPLIGQAPAGDIGRLGSQGSGPVLLLTHSVALEWASVFLAVCWALLAHSQGHKARVSTASKQTRLKVQKEDYGLVPSWSPPHQPQAAAFLSS